MVSSVIKTIELASHHTPTQFQGLKALFIPCVRGNPHKSGLLTVRDSPEKVPHHRYTSDPQRQENENPSTILSPMISFNVLKRALFLPYDFVKQTIIWYAFYPRIVLKMLLLLENWTFGVAEKQDCDCITRYCGHRVGCISKQDGYADIRPHPLTRWREKDSEVLNTFLKNNRASGNPPGRLIRYLSHAGHCGGANLSIPHL